MEAPDFLKEDALVVEPMTEDAMASLEALMEQYKSWADENEKLKSQLENATKRLNNLVQEQIPTMMLSHGLKRMVFKDGSEVNVIESLKASVKKENQGKFATFLQDRDEDDIVKRTYKLGPMSKETRGKLHDVLIDSDTDYDTSTGVHPKTAQKYWTEYLKDNTRDTIPEWVSVFDFRIAKIDL